VCSECAADGDCGAGGACVDDTANSDVFVCAAGYGELCSSGADCASGFCFDTGFGGSLCSECEADGDCAGSLVCEFSLTELHAQCVGSTPAGGTCTTNSDCASNNCRGNVCLGELGDACTAPADCGSGYCFDGTIAQICSLCETTADCGGSGICFFRAGRGYAACN
jgi:hypothetical protein